MLFFGAKIMRGNEKILMVSLAIERLSSHGDDYRFQLNFVFLYLTRILIPWNLLIVPVGIRKVCTAPFKDYQLLLFTL